MRDYAELVKQTRESLSEVSDCMGCCVGWSIRENKCLLDHCADAIGELLAGLERYRHAAFVISETCVEESKCHISPEEAIKKIRENIYYFRQMPLPEPPKEVE